MLSNKLGVSIPWKYRTSKKDILFWNEATKILLGFFKKQGIFFSELYIKEFPIFIFIHFSIFPHDSSQYKIIRNLLLVFCNFIKILCKKNVQTSCTIAPCAYYNSEILGEQLNVQIFNDPLTIKKLFKKASTNYVTVIKQSKNNR